MIFRNFRQNIIDSKYILLLPLIAACELWKINRTSSLSNHESQLFNYYLLINACIVLLAYRFNVFLGSFTLFNAGLFVILYYQQTFSIPFFSIGFLSFILIFNLITLKLLWILPVKYSRCFTFAEFAIVFQTIYYYVVSICLFNWQYWIVNDGSSMMLVAQKFDTICLVSYLIFFLRKSFLNFIHKIDLLFNISHPLDDCSIRFKIGSDYLFDLITIIIICMVISFSSHRTIILVCNILFIQSN